MKTHPTLSNKKLKEITSITIKVPQAILVSDLLEALNSVDKDSVIDYLGSGGYPFAKNIYINYYPAVYKTPEDIAKSEEEKERQRLAKIKRKETLRRKELEEATRLLKKHGLDEVADQI